MIKVFKSFFDFCGKVNKQKFYLSIFLGVLIAFLEALKVPAAFIIVKGLVENDFTAKTWITATLILVISVILTILVKTKSTMLQTEAGYGTCANKRIEIAEHMRYLPMGYFNENSLGYITSVTTNTMEAMSEVATKVVMMTLQGTITALLIILMMFIYEPIIGLIVLCGFFIFLFANSYLQKRAGELADRKDNVDRNLVSKVIEYVQGMSEVKSYSLFSSQNKRLTKAIDEAEKINFDLEVKLVPLISLQLFITKCIGVVTCIVSIYLYTTGSMALANCIVMNICAFMIYSSLDSAGSFSSLLRIINVGVEKANSILNLEPMDVKGEDITPKNFDISFDNVSFSYEKRKIIDGVTLYIKEGTTTAIVGPSGSGKTTLCRLMARFWDVDSGSITLGGKDVRDYSIDSLMKNFSFVFQNVYLFEDTIANNIRFGKPEASMEEVIEVAKKACCHEFIEKLPNGYNTIIGEAGSSLSGGEKQRISIARAIMKDAPIIILDEATANVDPENEKELMLAIKELTKQKTIIMIAHRLKTVRNADKILVIDSGKIVQEGKHSELIKEEGIYKRFINIREQAISWRI